YIKSIRLVIFDNPQSDISLANNSKILEDAYLNGINVAINVAASEGIHIDTTIFFHSENVFEIMKKASDAKSDKPNIIMGFHSSNDFLMAKAFFGDQLVLSIAASDPKLATLPANFYSLGVPDKIESNIIIQFIKEHYINTNIFITLAAESKETVDFSNLLANSYKEVSSSAAANKSEFLTEDMHIIKMDKFMTGYKPNDPIIIMPSGFSSGIALMNKIAAYLMPIKPIFITASDNWGADNLPQPAQGAYDAYHIDTLSGGRNSKDYQVFAENFEKLYHTPPKYTISYVTYRTVMSFVTALIKYPPPKELNTTQAVVWSYQQALKHDPNWFRPTEYVVYKLTPTKEVYFETLQQS
ncbi:MAG: hypothetical protein HKM04_00340, partial [Legionellales bacterium]|nr:hypothetical protein [Legionellales bacterium]